MYGFEAIIEKLKKEYDPRYAGKLEIGSEAMRLGYIMGAWDAINSMRVLYEEDEDEEGLNVLGK